MKKLFLNVYFVFIAMISAASVGLAQDMGFVAGIRADSADATGTGYKVDSRTNFNVGVLGFFEFSEVLSGRAGFLYTQRSYGITISTLTVQDSKFTYFDVPFGAMWNFSDYGGVFAGGVLALNLSKDCLGSCQNVNSSPLGYQFGASFKFMPQIGAEIYYEALTSKVEEAINNPRAVVVNLLVTFD